MGRLNEVEKMYERALQGKEKVLKPEHASTLDTINKLSLLYAEMERHDETEKMYERAMRYKEKA
jgi:lipopolysaccharide biosynthesis regulator YciM